MRSLVTIEKSEKPAPLTRALCGAGKSKGNQEVRGQDDSAGKGRVSACSETGAALTDCNSLAPS